MQVTTTGKATQYTNHIAICVDGSGSMASRKAAVVKAFNQLIADIRENAKMFKRVPKHKSKGK